MSETLDPHNLFSQLQTRYPASSLICELVQIHKDSFVVRSLVQVGGVTLATSMAAAPTVELAEEQARLRVLKLLGILSANVPEPLKMPASYETQAQLLSSPLDNPALFPPPGRADRPLPPSPPVYSPFDAKDLGELLPPKPLVPMVDALDRPFEPDETLPPADDFLPAPPEPEEFVPEPPSESVSKPRKSASPEPMPVPEPIETSAIADLSDPVAQIPLEMERIGWTVKRGREHLEQTYNKRSRAQLTDDELLDFLKFLKSHPSANQAPFKQ
jgi:hypothetical protein